MRLLHPHESLQVHGANDLSSYLTVATASVTSAVLCYVLYNSPIAFPEVGLLVGGPLSYFGCSFIFDTPIAHYTCGHIGSAMGYYFASDLIPIGISIFVGATVIQTI